MVHILLKTIVSEAKVLRDLHRVDAVSEVNHKHGRYVKQAYHRRKQINRSLKLHLHKIDLDLFENPFEGDANFCHFLLKTPCSTVRFTPWNGT